MSEMTNRQDEIVRGLAIAKRLVAQYARCYPAEAFPGEAGEAVRNLLTAILEDIDREADTLRGELFACERVGTRHE